jgi:hypothetical protein
VKAPAPTLALPLVFVPLIGFRPAGTRMLREPAETIVDGTRLRVLGLAASPQRTELLIEWERAGDPVVCPPGSQLLSYQARAPLDNGVTVELATGSTRLSAVTMVPRGYHASMQSIGAIHALTFPPTDDAGDERQLSVTENGNTWRVALGLQPSRVAATPLDARLEHEGIVLRATAVARDVDEVALAVEVEASRNVRQVGAPLPTSAIFADDSEELRRQRKAEFRRTLGDRARPITLEDDRGGRHEEVRRLLTFEPQRTDPGGPFIHRFAVIFETLGSDAHAATLVIPFIDLSDPDGSVTADLRSAPLELAVGRHRFRVVSAEPIAKDHRLVIVEGRPSPWPPRFRHPAAARAADASSFPYPNPGLGEQVSFGVAVKDPPVVTFSGAVFRVDGPVRLRMPIA